MKALTLEQAVVLTVMTGSLLVKPHIFRQEIAKKLGREINSIEFANDKFVKDMQALYQDDYTKMLDIEEFVIIVPDEAA